MKNCIVGILLTCPIYKIPILCDGVNFVSCFVTLLKASTSDIVYRTIPKRSVTMENIIILLQFLSV